MYDLFDHPEPDPEPTMASRFRDFHRRHPEVYRRLVLLARRWVARGRTYGGIGMFYEVIRWETGMGDTDAEFKLSNNHRAFYARLIMKRCPDLADLFRTKPSEADAENFGTSQIG